MNFGFNLLSNYSPAEADWGIEEPVPPRNRFNSTTTSEYSQPPPLRYDYGIGSPTGFRTTSGFRAPSVHGLTPSERDYGDFSQVNLKLLQPNTENFHRFIRKYLCLNQNAQIIEKFKYNLVISNLLDDTLVLSKNEQALNNLVQIKNNIDNQLHLKLARDFNFDGAELYITGKQYRLLYPAIYNSPLLLVSTICLIIFLLKQNIKVRSNLPYGARIQMFKILLIISTKVVKFKRAAITIEAAKSLRSLDDFMISNCKANKILISSMISLKEFEMFSFLNKSEEPAWNYSRHLKAHVNTLLTCLLLNVKHSISALLPFSNGVILEKYCQINNVHLGLIFDDAEAQEETLEGLTAKLNLFNNYRRFFICQLLTFHDTPHCNFFVLKLYDCFKIEDHSVSFVTTSEKLRTLEKAFREHTLTLNELHALNEKFRRLNNPTQPTDYVNDNVLSSSSTNYTVERDEVFAPETELNLSNLINKLLNLTTSLKYFKKYSQSISGVNDAEEYDEKLTIFGLFGTEMQNAMEMYKVCMSDYQSDFTQKFVPSNGSSRSNSQRNSLNSNDQFSLKSFHTVSSTSIKKRFSLPTQPKTEAISTGKTADKRYKRLSTGLQLGLLTVLEEPKGEKGRSPLSPTLPTNARNVSYDDNYINILPPTTYESYNQASLEALTKKINIRNSMGRFSMNSVNSNVSGLSELIASTQMTEEDGDVSKTGFSSGNGAQGMSKEELKKRLEESFTRIYSLENENQELKLKADAPGEPDDFTDGDVVSTVAKDSAFLSDLERTLTAKVQQ